MKTSAQVELRSPLSMRGFFSRYWRVTSTKSPTLRIVMMVPRVIVLVAIEAVLFCWNLMIWTCFFWFTIIWRHFRNAHRRDKRNQMQHQELLTALNKTQG